MVRAGHFSHASAPPGYWAGDVAGTGQGSGGNTERDLLDRLVVRVPALAGLIAARFSRVKPGSSVRSRLINLQVRRAFAAMARSDVDVVALS